MDSNLIAHNTFKIPAMLQPRSQGLSSLRLRRDPGNEVGYVGQKQNDCVIIEPRSPYSKMSAWERDRHDVST